jgi:hypothetical protein
MEGRFILGVLLFSFNGREIHIGVLLFSTFNGREIHIGGVFCINNFRLYAD